MIFVFAALLVFYSILFGYAQKLNNVAEKGINIEVKVSHQ
jgi:hypothetical protein